MQMLQGYGTTCISNILTAAGYSFFMQVIPNVTWLLKAGIAGPEKTSIWLATAAKHISVATKTRSGPAAI
jgi:hypothetical protein